MPLLAPACLTQGLSYKSEVNLSTLILIIKRLHRVFVMWKLRYKGGFPNSRFAKFLCDLISSTAKLWQLSHVWAYDTLGPIHVLYTVVYLRAREKTRGWQTKTYTAICWLFLVGLQQDVSRCDMRNHLNNRRNRAEQDSWHSQTQLICFICITADIL